MYERHFGLNQLPFSIAPDPRYLFMSERHREALAHLLYGVRGGGGFVVLTGDIGAGKTTVCRCFLEQIPEHCNVAYIFNPKLTVDELLKTICDEFGIEYRHEGAGTPTVKDYVDALNEHLLRTHAAGQDNVLIIDEAQNLSADVLEQLRLLTNLETSERKLLQIVLIGQPELRTMLARPELEQLSQRVIARYHLDALSETETTEYVRHRLAVAGLTRALPFGSHALRRIWRYTRGVPRRINLLCDRALLGAYSQGAADANARVIDLAAREVLNVTTDTSAFTRNRVALAVAVLVVLVIGGVLLLKPAPYRVSGASAELAVSEPVTQASASEGPAATQGKPSTESARTAPDVSATPAVPVPAATDAYAQTPVFALATGFASLVGAEKDAWQTLAREWNLTLGEGDPCAQAARERLKCFERGDSSLALIRQIDRPVLLKLRDGGGRTAFAVLVGLTDTHSLLNIGGVPRKVSLMSLAEYWRGDFVTLWSVPPDSPAASGRGHRIDPLWLARRLAAVRGAKAPAGPVDERTLREWIYSFQLAQGMRADGVPGPLTVMLLNRATGVPEPRLRKEV